MRQRHLKESSRAAPIWKFEHRLANNHFFGGKLKNRVCFREEASEGKG